MSSFRSLFFPRSSPKSPEQSLSAFPPYGSVSSSRMGTSAAKERTYTGDSQEVDDNGADDDALGSSPTVRGEVCYFNIQGGARRKGLPVYVLPEDNDDDDDDGGDGESSSRIGGGGMGDGRGANGGQGRQGGGLSGNGVSSPLDWVGEQWRDEMGLFGGTSTTQSREGRGGHHNSLRVLPSSGGYRAEPHGASSSSLVSAASSSPSMSQDTADVAWMPDTHVSRCYTCEAPFTLTRRRHHCRVCGMVFCSKCSGCWIESDAGKVRCCKGCAKEFEGRAHESKRELRAKAKAEKGSSAKDSDRGVPTENGVPSGDSVATESPPPRATPSAGPVAAGRAAADGGGLEKSSAPLEKSLYKPEFSRLEGFGHHVDASSGVVNIGGKVVSISPVDESSTNVVSPLELQSETKKTKTKTNSEYVNSPETRSGGALSDASVDSKDTDALGPSSSRAMTSDSSSTLESQARSHLERQTEQLLQTSCPDVPAECRGIWLRSLINLSLRCTCSLDTNGGAALDPLHFIHIKTIPGAQVQDSALISGVVMRGMPIRKSMVEVIHNPRILLLQTGISFQRGGEGSQRIASIDTLLESEEKYMEILVNRIDSACPDVLMTGGSVCNMAQRLLAKKKIVVLQNVKKAVMERLGWACQAEVLTGLELITGKNQAEYIGNCKRFRTVVFRTEDAKRAGLDDEVIKTRGEGKSVKDNPDRMKILAAAKLGDGSEDGRRAVYEGTSKRGVTTSYCLFEGCPRHKGSTAVLRGGSRKALKQIKRVFQLVVHVAYNLRLETSYLAERCATLGDPSKMQHQMDMWYSSSLAVDYGKMPFGRNLRPWSGNTAWDKHRPDNAGSRVTTFDHQSILVTSVWLAGNVQCSPAEVKGICYYTDQDVSLGQFLQDSCFNLGLKCQNPSCKKSVLDHTLSFVHNDGQVNIKVEQMYSNLPTVADSNDASRSEASRKPLEGSNDRESAESSQDGSGSDGDGIAMWSYCHKCRKVVTPLVYICDDTWRFSFGKFLEVFFYNKEAFMNLESSSGCNHNMQADTTLYFGCKDLAASFTYQPIKPYQVFVRRNLSFDGEFHRVKSHRDLMDVKKVAALFLSKFKKRVEAMSTETVSLLINRATLREHVSVVQAELGNISSDIQGSKTTIESMVKSVIEMHCHYVETAAKQASYKVSRNLQLATLLPGLGTPYPSSAASPMSAEDVLRFPWRTRRNLFLLCSAWNDRLSIAGQALTAMKRNKDGPTPALHTANSSHSATHDENIEDIMDRVGKLIETTSSHAAHGPHGNIESVGDSVEVSLPSNNPASSHITNKSLSPMIMGLSAGGASEDGGGKGGRSNILSDIEATTPSPMGLPPAKSAAKRQSSSDIYGHEEQYLSSELSRSASRKQATGKPATATVAVKSAINRLFNRGNKESDPYVVDISDLERGRPRLEPGMRGEVIAVYEDQPATIIAYSLSSRGYHDQFMQYYEEGSGERKSFTRAERSNVFSSNSKDSERGDGSAKISSDVMTNSAGTDGAAQLEGDKNAAGAVEKSLKGVRFPGRQNVTGAEPPSTANASGKQSKSRVVRDRKELERRMLLRGKTHVKHHFRDAGAKDTTFCKYVCTTYWATQFQAVRKAYFTTTGQDERTAKKDGDEKGSFNHLDDDASYIKSLATSFSWEANGGKSGASFAKTEDERFVVKCISRTELQMFLDCAPAYFEYLSKAFFHGLPTVLCKIVGVYEIGFHNRITGKRNMEQVAVMQNIFYKRKVAKIFDLKGSTRNRYVYHNNKNGESLEGRARSVTGTGAGAGVAGDTRTSDSIIEKDPANPGTGSLDKKSKKSDVSKSASAPALNGASADTNDNDNGDNTVLLDENFLEFTNGRPLPLTDRARAIFHMSILNDTLFLSIINIIDYSILVGIDTEKHELVVGIIDYMRQYDIIKQMERVGKSVGMIAGAQQPTIIQPNLYKNRFQNAMEKFFTTVPTKWTSTSLASGK